MGREIRRVPPGWEHPKRQTEWGYDYAPLVDESFEEAQAAWEEARRAFDRTDCTFEEWHGGKPDNPIYYRPAWDEETRTAFQVYETVSEGTPTSPVFESEEDLVSWLVEEGGHSEAAAREFVRVGSVPSMMVMGNRIASNIEMLEPGFMPPKAGD